MFVQSVGDASSAIDRRLGQGGLIEEHVHEVSEQPGGRAAIIITGVEIIGTYKDIIAWYETHLFVATAVWIVRVGRDRRGALFLAHLFIAIVHVVFFEKTDFRKLNQTKIFIIYTINKITDTDRNEMNFLLKRPS